MHVHVHAYVRERAGIERTCSLSRTSTVYVGGMPSLSPKRSQKPTLPCLLASSARPISSRSDSLSSPPGDMVIAVSTSLEASTPASITASDGELDLHGKLVVVGWRAKTSHCMKRTCACMCTCVCMCTCICVHVLGVVTLHEAHVAARRREQRAANGLLAARVQVEGALLR